MKYLPDDAHDQADLERMNAEPWMVEQLKLNPDYLGWGPHEDYMCKEGQGWDSRIILDTWPEMARWALDELNECVNFYFEINRESEDCDCGEGYNPETKKIADGFYSFEDRSKAWHNKITQDEVDALIASNRLWDFWREVRPSVGWVDKDPKPVVTAEMVNAAQTGLMRSHDAINRCILVETRARRLGVYGLCEKCEGRGFVYTAPAATLGLVLWWLHPRKGCSRGIEVKRVERNELPQVFRFLRTAAERNAERFSKIPNVEPESLVDAVLAQPEEP